VFENIRRKLYFQIALEVQQSKFKVRHKKTKKRTKRGRGENPAGKKLEMEEHSSYFMVILE